MILSRLEFLLMNNPLRRAVQWHFEARRFLRMGGPLPGARALEIGCGQGVGAEIILDLFGAASVDAFDLDPRMVAMARRRLRSRSSQVRLWVGDAADLKAPDNTYDAVFAFGVIHHVSNWRQVLAEVNRVLLPGGLLFAEEPVGWCTQQPFKPFLARLFGYPRECGLEASGYGFDASEFRRALTAAGFILQKESHFLHTFSWFVASKACWMPDSRLADPPPTPGCRG